jgi:hypothetical protein
VIAITGFVFAARWIAKTVALYPEFNLTIERVELDAAACEWLPEEAREVVEAIPLSISDMNLLSEETLSKVYLRLLANPWVKDVYSVEKVFPDRIRFSLALRRPVAWIRQGRRMYLVDAECVRLPVGRKNTPEISHIPVIEGLSNRTAVPLPGCAWRSRPVAEGVCVAGYLLSDLDLLMSETGRIRFLDVSGVRSDGRGVVLMTEDRQRIEWGRTRLSGKMRLVSDQEKLASLQLILEGKKSFIDNQTYYRLWTRPPTAGRLERTAGNVR